MEWCIKSVNRSALTAFAPYGAYIATGTMAGAVDLQFSSSAHLDVFELDFASDNRQLILAGSSPSSERFNRLSWGKRLTNSEEYSFGLIAGGLVDGNIGLWNPKPLISKHKNGSDTSDNAFVGNLPRQKGSARGLEFNSLSPNHLASGGEEGDICIWDVSKPSEPSHFPPLKGSRSAAQGEISFLSWNNKVQHILASTSYNGTTVVWDLKKQKPVISFTDSVRRSCSVLQWHPDITTQLIVASDDDSSPSLSLWDMRNILAPVKEFVGHTKGVVAMSWCPSDSTYLLTCAKDNRTIFWDTVSGEIVAELPAGTNQNFDVHWYSKIPGVISASSFHGKIGIYNIEGCGRYGLDESDIGAASLRAPKWYNSKAGVSFGFGGKLISFHSTEAGSSEVYAHDLVTEHGLVSRSSEFEAAIKNGDKSSLKLLCERKSQESESDEERESWGFMKVMFTEDGTARSKLLSHLGFSLPAEESDIKDNEVSQQGVLRPDESMADKEEFATDNGEDFFNNLPSPKVDTPLSTSKNEYVNGDSVNESQQEMNGLEESSDASFDDVVQRALVVGDYKGAVAQCVSANRLADALVIAHIGGAALWERTRDQYLKTNRSQYLKVVYAMVNNDLMSIAKTRPLKSWKETLALFCTFAQTDEWTLLCDTLAARLVAADDTTAATLCYICAGNIDKAVDMWSKNLAKEHNDKPYVDRLQDLMEKIFVFALAAGLKRFSASLYKLVEKYAEILTSQGLLTTAMEYLNLLGTEELSTELIILRDHLSLSTKPDTEIESTGTYESSQFQNGTAYDANQSSYGATDASQRYYQNSGPPQVQPTIPSSPYTENYHQQSAVSFSGDYSAPPTYQTNGQSSRFVPSPPIPAPTVIGHFPPVNIQPPVNFVPANPVSLKNAEQYQQPSSLVSQLYPVAANPSYQPGPPVVPYGATTSQVGPTPGHMMSQVLAPPPPSKVFMPVSKSGPGMNQSQPPTPTQPAPAQAAQQIVTAPPTVQTVDTSNVPAHQKAVVATLRRIYNETSEVLGGNHPVKKREIEDISRKLGALFAKLNSVDMSKNVSEMLQHLCQALDRADYATALQIQVRLTTTDWDECNVWLAPLKRMIKAKQNLR